MNERADDRPAVWRMVDEAVRALGGCATNASVRRWIWDRYPGTNRSTIDCQICARCVNSPARVHFSSNRRPRNANHPELDLYFQPDSGRIELYDPERHGKWEIYQTPEGKLGVRQTAQWPRSDEPPPVVVASDEQPQPGGSGENAWVEQLQPRLEQDLQRLSFANTTVRVEVGRRLPYAYEVMRYTDKGPEPRSVKYQTDLLVFDNRDDSGVWTPRVIIECKIRGVTTHDALTYSTKAATHKQVHPYLRYGMLVGNYRGSLPQRLVRHGAHFDFVAVWDRAEPSNRQWNQLIEVLDDEVRGLAAASGGDRVR